MTDQLDTKFATSMKGGKFPGELLALRNHLLDIHTFPYATGASIAVNIIRFAPAALRNRLLGDLGVRLGIGCDGSVGGIAGGALVADIAIFF